MAAPAIPSGSTFFDQVKRSFTDVPIDKEHGNAVSTSEFLEASESLTTLFDVLGSVAFKPVKNDIIGNVKVSRLKRLEQKMKRKNELQRFEAWQQMERGLKHKHLKSISKIRDRQLAAPAQSENIQDLVRNELATKKHIATEGLLWLIRALDFTAQSLRRNLTTDTEELADSFRGAYTNTLKPHHSFVIKPIFSAAMSATPYRKDFYKKLGDDDEKVKSTLETWLAALENIVAILKAFLETKEAKW